MRTAIRLWLLVAVVCLTGRTLPAQAPPSSEPVQAPKPAAANPAPTGVAATVNGQPISEAAVQRALKRVPPARHAEARPEILNFLIDNLLLDQHLQQLAVAVDAKEVDKRLEQIRNEIKEQGEVYEKVLQQLWLTEQELRAQITADVRWEQYVATQANDKVLRELFDANKTIFDGSLVRARHILLTTTPELKTPDQVKTRLLLIKKEVEDQVAAGLAKVPPQTDNLERERQRIKLLDESFAVAAAKHSTCPSKSQGGDVGWFPRAGSMVEPFARAAFALKSYELSDVVTTEFGCHLVLPIDRREGREVKFEDVKEEAREVYADRLRDAWLVKLRPTAKVVITPTAKP